MPRRSILMPLAALAFVPAPAMAQTDPHAIVRAAMRAVEGDSAPRVAARWRARVARDSLDRAAVFGLATLSRLTYDYEAAERHFAALTLPTRGAPDAYAVYAELGRAQALAAQDRTAESRRAFDRALAVARTSRVAAAEAEALVGVSMVRFSIGGADVGLAALDSAQRLIPESDFALRAEHRRRRATLFSVLARPEARAEAESSLVLARRSGNPSAEGNALRAIAYVLSVRGQDDSAVVLTVRSESLYHRGRDWSLLAKTRLQRANSLVQRGDLGAAKTAAHLALAEGVRARTIMPQGSAHAILGAVAQRVGDHLSALSHLEKARAFFDAGGDSLNLMLVLGRLAWTDAVRGDRDAARRRLTVLLDWHRRGGDVLEQLDIWRGFAELDARDGRWEAAARALRMARFLARTNALPIKERKLAYDEGQLAARRGDLRGAQRHFSSFLSSLDSTEHVARHDARLHLAAVHARLGDISRAERELLAATDELDRWRARLADHELRTLVFQSSWGELASPDESLARVIAALVTHGRAESAFHLAERRRARELADRLVQARALREAAGGGATDAIGPSAPGGTSATTIAARLPDARTALLEYVVGCGGAPTTLFVVTRSGLSAYLLAPIDSLAPSVSRFVSLVESGAAPEMLARQLGTAVLDQAVAGLPLDVTRLMVVPDGILHRLPVDALRARDGRLIVERFSVNTVPSAGVALALWDSPRRQGGGARMLAMGDAAFAAAPVPAGQTGGSANDVYRSAFEAAGGLPRLEASGREARLVARYARDARLLLREEASAAALLREPLDRYRVLHLATHAVVDQTSAARTALALAPGGGEDGFLGPGDLASLRLDADLVVLSACRSAGGALIGGEGIQGLTAPLLQAGARAVVATAWRIQDRATLPFVRDLYDAMAAGQPVGDALRTAKLRAIARGAPASAWAAFTVVGDPFARPPLEPPLVREPGRFWSLLAAAAAALIAVLVLLYRGRNRSARAAERVAAPSIP